MNLHRIVYCSDASNGNIVEGRNLARVIAAASDLPNRTSQLTGSLIFVAGSFIQVLEGPLKELEKTFERICCDPRHNRLKLVDFREVPQRQFASWSMACLTDGDTDEPCFRAMLNDIRSSLMISVPHTLAKMLSLLEGELGEGYCRSS